MGSCDGIDCRESEKEYTNRNGESEGSDGARYRKHIKRK